ncbi:ribonuclease H-like domain-containing protein [Tanacetum coccineum]
MVTRAKAGISKPLARMNCHATTTSPIPRSHLHALCDPHWHKAMVDEYNALISNETWVLVPRPTNVNIVRSMWLFKLTYNSDGSLSMYKARLVANGRSQQQRIDCDETFSPVVKHATIRIVLSLPVTRFVDFAHPDYVCHLRRSLYGLKQVVSAVCELYYTCRFSAQQNRYVTFFYHQGSDIAYLLLYVDGIVLTASSTALSQRIITLLHGEFAMTDLGFLNYFLGISAQRSKFGLFLSQSKFAAKILERAYMQHCNPCKTLVDTESKLGSDGDPTLYRSLAGALQYLTFTRPDISYDVQQICLYMNDPRDPHFHALNRILRYVRGTIDHDLQLHSAKRQVTLSCSSVEAEYRGVANVVAEVAWIRNLLLELHAPLTTATLVYCDNVRVLHVPSRFQYANIFTKGLSSALFLEFRSSLNVRKPSVPTAKDY